MNASSPTPNTRLTLMTLGADTLAAENLAQAVNGLVQPFDAAALTDHLKSGSDAIVLWAAPQTVVANAMRAGEDAELTLTHWSDQMTLALALFRKYRRRIMLVDQRLLHSGDASLRQPLARRLGLADLPVPQPASAPDLTGMLTDLLASQLAALLPFWDELVASSLPIDLGTFALADLAPITRTLAAQRDTMVALRSLLTQTRSEGETEASLLRQGLRDLMAMLQHTGAEGETTAHALTEALAQINDLTDEVTGLRSTTLTVTKACEDLQIKLQQESQITNGLRQETGLLRAQVADLTGGLEALRLIDQARGETAAAHQEMDLLRAQLSTVTAELADLRALPAAQTRLAEAEAQLRQMDADRTLAQLETALLRQQLAEMTLALTAAQSAKQSETADRRAELIVVRNQMKHMSDTAAAWQGEAGNDLEIALLRDQLAALTDMLPRLGPTAALVDPSQIEAAIAGLLADLVRETELRLQAQQELLAARQTLRSMGFDGAMRPLRLGVAPRPTA